VLKIIDVAEACPSQPDHLERIRHKKGDGLIMGFGRVKNLTKNIDFASFVAHLFE
jgi:hypothetical protein